MHLMDDAEYVFRQDIRDKKSIGRGSFHKKCGARSKKCTLPSDHMTRKELRAMNSEPITWQMSTFYDYATFKTMPADIQVEYLQGITDKWKVGCSAVSEILFKGSKTSLDSYLRYRGLDKKVSWHGQTGMRARVYNAEFQKAVDEVMPIVVEEPTMAIPVPTVSPVSCDESKTVISTPIVSPISCDEPFSGKLVNTTISMDGFDQDTFGWLAQKYFGQNVIVTITVESK